MRDLGRYLGMDGKMGACPVWYGKAQVAKWLGVPVPDIDTVPLFWIHRALIAMSAEETGRKIKEQHKQ